jgi:hypothetical protein
MGPIATTESDWPPDPRHEVEKLYDRHIPQSEVEKRNRFFPSEIEAGMTEESLVARYNTVEARWHASPLCKDYAYTIGEKLKHAQFSITSCVLFSTGS